MTADNFCNQFEELNIPIHGVRLPTFVIEDSYKKKLNIIDNIDNYEFLRRLCFHGFLNLKLEKGSPEYTKYTERIERELSIMNELGYVDYILLVWDVVNFCEDSKIPTGYGRGCLTGNSPVKTLNGFKFLKDVTVGDKVINKLGQLDVVTNKFKYDYYSDLIELKVFGDTSSEIQMTPDHKVFCLKNPFSYTNYKSHNYIKGFSELNLKEFFSANKLSWVQAQDVKPNDYLVRAVGRINPIKDIKTIDLAKFNHEFDDNFVYEKRPSNKIHPLAMRSISRETGISRAALLRLKNTGPSVESSIKNELEKYLKSKSFNFEDFILFDGITIIKYPRYIPVDEDFCYVLGFFIGDGWCDKTRIGFAFHQEDNVKEISKISEYFQKLGTPTCICPHKKKKLNQLYVNSSTFQKLFCSLVPFLTNDKSIPADYLNLPDAKLRAILNGLIESDGSDCENRISFDSTSTKLIEQVRWLFEYFGFMCNTNTRNRKGCHISYKLRAYQAASGRFFNDGKYLFIKVREVKKVKNTKCKIFDITIKNDPSYSTDKFIVHNSAAGSLVLFLSGVTKVDPIKYGLFFERFISKVRAKKQVIDGITYLDGSLAPDVDLDICFYNRPKVIEYLEKKFAGRVCKILTFNTLSSKLLIKECGKIMGGFSDDQMTSITELIPKLHGKVKDVEEAYADVEDFAKWCNEHRQIYDVCLKLRGLIKNKGVHPSAVSISYNLLEEFTPTELDSEKSQVASYDMDWISLFNVKLDVLGLRGVSVVDDVCKAININMTNIDFENPFIYQQLQDFKNPHGVFQLEADTNYKVACKVKPRDLGELSAVLALARPGAVAYVDKYANYTNFGEYEGAHPFFDETLKKTGGLCLFQEQAMQMAVQIGFSKDEAEQIRRCITGDTLFISKTRGYISIDRLIKEGYKDDYFFTLDNNGKSSWQKIKNIWSTGIKQTRYVEAGNGLEVRATMYHQFLTDTGWKCRMRLVNGDYLVSPRCIEYDGTDYISEDLAIIISGIIAEGYFPGYAQTTFTNFDKDMLETFRTSFLKVFKKEPILRPSGTVFGIKKEETLYIHQFLPFGLSASKFLPEQMMGMTKETTRKFLSFLLACEGGISQSNIDEQRWFEFSSKSKKLAQQVQLLLIRFGIYSKLRKKTVVGYGDFWSVFIKEYGLLKTLFSELIVCWPSIKKQQLRALIDKERVLNFSYDLIPQSIIKLLGNQYPFCLSMKSGRMYSENVNRDTFKRIVGKTNDKFWSNLANGNFYYNKFVSQDRVTREVEVYDFQMENEDVPFIVANGIVIHNCIGKKKIEEIKSWEQKIQEKIISNKLDPKIGEVFWKILQDSGGYQFNLSHSVAYASLSAATIFLKFTYPTQFFLSLLKMSRHEPDAVGEISKIHKEMAAFDIKLLRPHITKSKLDFSVEGKDIRFGLLSIRGISDKSIEKLNSFCHEYSTKFEVFEAASQHGVNIGVLCALIQAGAFEGFKQSRTKVVYEAQLWNILTNKEKKLVTPLAEQFDFDLVAIMRDIEKRRDEKSKPLIRPSRMDTIRKHSKKYAEIFEMNKASESFANWYYEKKLLGYTHNKSLKDIFIGRFPNLQCIKDIKELRDNDEVYFVASVDDNAQTKTSKAGNKYMMFDCSDDSGATNVKIFAKQLEPALLLNDGKSPKKDNIVVVKGKKKDGNCIFAELFSIQTNKIYCKLAELKADKADKVDKETKSE